MQLRSVSWSAASFFAMLLAAFERGSAQTPPGMHPPGEEGSSNIHVLSHIPLGRIFTVGDIEIEQELSRPYAYVPRLHGTTASAGFDIISVKDPANAKVIYYWHIENAELHQGAGCLQNKYFKIKGRYYTVQGCQFQRSGPDGDLGAVVVDVTGLPDTMTIREVGRVRAPDTPGGFHNVYNYKHSDGRALMFATTSGRHANVYDMEKFLAKDLTYGLVGRVPLPEAPGASTTTYHDFYVGYDPVTHQDKFYGAGGGGYFVFDVSKPEEPRLLTSVTGISGVSWGHTFTPTPDGRYAVTEAEYQYAPLRIFDLKPGLDETAKTVSRPVGAWTARWDGCPHNTEVRWPYVFTSAYEDGFWVFNIMDPTSPYTVGYYDTYDGPNQRGRAVSGNPEAGFWDPSSADASGYAGGGRPTVSNGAFGVDVRNADGLIVVSDLATGFWAFKMEGFDGWNGHQWGMPNVSSAQDWDNGPDGAPKPQKVSIEDWSQAPTVRHIGSLLVVGNAMTEFFLVRRADLLAVTEPAPGH